MKKSIRCCIPASENTSEENTIPLINKDNVTNKYVCYVFLPLYFFMSAISVWLKQGFGTPFWLALFWDRSSRILPKTFSHKTSPAYSKMEYPKEKWKYCEKVKVHVFGLVITSWHFICDKNLLSILNQDGDWRKRALIYLLDRLDFIRNLSDCN